MASSAMPKRVHDLNLHPLARSIAMVPTARAQFKFTLFLIAPQPAPPSETGGATAAGVAACVA